MSVRHLVPLALALAFAPLSGGKAFAEPGLSRPEPIGAYLNGAFPTRAPGAVTPGSGAWTQRDYFPDVSFVEPLRVVEHPTRNELVVLGKDALGHLITHEEGATDKRPFLDLRPIVHGNPESGEGGISDIVFHPRFGRGSAPESRYVYLSYWYSPDNSGGFSNDDGVDGYNRVSRFEVRDDRVDLATEEVLISQYDREYWHLGMDMEFGEDGFLYISVGDETPTTCCDRADSTQRLDGGLWSGVLRIDVDNDPDKSHPIRRQPRHPSADPTDNGPNWSRSFTQGYSIPNDNPFLSPDGSRLEEFYSLGLRHPWTMSIDAPTGEVWVGDVGRFKREELNLITKGANHQWPFREGTIAGPDNPPGTVLGRSTPPVWDYSHEVGVAVILGGVYRGERHPELVGKVLFSDFKEGHLWTATKRGGGHEVERIGQISAGWSNGVSAYLMDSKGQVLMVRTNGALRDGGQIDLLHRENGGAEASPAPRRLSDTGAFTDLLSRTPVEGCLSYEENVPFWSDGALKSRWLCLPNDGRHDSAAERIGFAEEGPWTFPVGTVLVKHFDMEAEEGVPSSAFPLETRFFVVGEEGYYGLSYRWNEAGTDAVLVGATGESRSFRQVALDGAAMTRQWDYPSRGECLECHTENAGSALGLNTRQLNGPHLYERSGLMANQIETFAHLGMFDGSAGILARLPELTALNAMDDLGAPVEARARGYLDANCGYCHQPGGVRARFDARHGTPLAEQGLIDGELIEGVGIEGEAVIVPGDPSRSIVHYRTARLGAEAMPPLAKNRVDEAGVALIEEWIVSLGAGEPPPEPAPEPSPDPNAGPEPQPGAEPGPEPTPSPEPSDDDPPGAGVGGGGSGGGGGGGLSIALSALLLFLLGARLSSGTGNVARIQGGVRGRAPSIGRDDLGGEARACA